MNNKKISPPQLSPKLILKRRMTSDTTNGIQKKNGIWQMSPRTPACPFIYPRGSPRKNSLPRCRPSGPPRGHWVSRGPGAWDGPASGRNTFSLALISVSALIFFKVGPMWCGESSPRARFENIQSQESSGALTFIFSNPVAIKFGHCLFSMWTCVEWVNWKLTAMQGSPRVWHGILFSIILW